jgi:hypothetical protein
MRRLAPALILFAAVPALAEDAPAAGRRASRPDHREWDFALTAYPTRPREGENITSAIAAADSGPLHLEARYAYEQKDSRSAFVGWTFSGGETVQWELTPIVGGGWGPARSFIPGVEASLAWGPFDAYVEAEFVRHRHDTEDDFNYAWSELGFRATERLRIGAAFQHTRAYGARDSVQGPFIQLAWKQVTLGAYWFDPGGRREVFVGAIGISF